MTDEENSSLSILTLPFPVPRGPRISLDFFAQDASLLEIHLINQLHELRHPQHAGILTELDQSRGLKNIFLSIVVHPKMTSEMFDISSRLVLDQFRIQRGDEFICEDISMLF